MSVRAVPAVQVIIPAGVRLLIAWFVPFIRARTMAHPSALGVCLGDLPILAPVSLFIAGIPQTSGSF